MERSGNFQVSFIDFNSQGALDEINREDDPTPVFSPDNNAFQSLERASTDTNASAPS